jgi:hypothetical protein
VQQGRDFRIETAGDGKGFRVTIMQQITLHFVIRDVRAIGTLITEDRTINPDLELFMAKRMGAKTIEVK